VLPLLLIRCVDWVRPIRDLARPLVLSKLDKRSLRAMLLGLDTAVAHLADRSSAVRTMAQALVLRAGGDPAAHCRTPSACSPGSARPGRRRTPAGWSRTSPTNVTPTSPSLRDPALAADAHQDIHAWLQHSARIYTRPSPELAAEIEAGLPALDPAQAREIRFTLGANRHHA